MFLMRKQKRLPRQRSVKKKERYKINNWPEYNRSLKLRGSLKIWIPYWVLQNWYYKGANERGSPLDYSDSCIEFCLTMKAVYNLGYRQTEGFIESIFLMRKIRLSVPCYSALCKRSKTIKVSHRKRYGKKGKKKIGVSADSTGLKVYGEGEWKVRKHGWSQHRTWQLLHLAINPNERMILGSALTKNGVDDAAMVPALLQQVKQDIMEFSGDGAYDKRKVYDLLAERKIKPIIPPRKNARIGKHGNSKGPSNPRDKNIRMIRKYGRKKWKRKVGYHRRSLAETTMFRYKTIFGGTLYSRTFDRQKTETGIACKILNIMTQSGMPDSIKIARSP